MRAGQDLSARAGGGRTLYQRRSRWSTGSLEIISGPAGARGPVVCTGEEPPIAHGIIGWQDPALSPGSPSCAPATPASLTPKEVKKRAQL
ncbi:hypothetical protein IscW_ISCW008634 [Ixodes scapularis]|uniref:Uncharacterized protein n=1 Tax=Ixodes scapularis TaxID=6945 RepID=B7PZN6_IXOSC|nr:hypothetical protein IscW_ISCW008634 [Ixodes scapularis]|eukprot:XP_002405737.1 hypothetical protein IscW_ISCW008634 [Ixodes scapularis]